MSWPWDFYSFDVVEQSGIARLRAAEIHALALSAGGVSDLDVLRLWRHATTAAINFASPTSKISRGLVSYLPNRAPRIRFPRWSGSPPMAIDFAV